MTLEEATAAFCKPFLDKGNNRDWYTWRLPRNLPSGIKIPAGNSYTRTIALRDSLSVSLRVARKKKKVELTRFYIADWGGVRRNSDATISDYATAHENELINKLARGIASWSKALALREPDTYAIYDARVAFSLNALQFLFIRENDRVLFPMPPGRNTTIAPARAFLKGEQWDIQAVDFYVKYLALLRSVAATLSKACGQRVRICEVEMCLFAKAEELATKILQK